MSKVDRSVSKAGKKFESNGEKRVAASDGYGRVLRWKLLDIPLVQAFDDVILTHMRAGTKDPLVESSGTSQASLKFLFLCPCTGEKERIRMCALVFQRSRRVRSVVFSRLASGNSSG